MTVNALDHINIMTDRLKETATFYHDAFGLEERDPPPHLDPAKIRWMFDASGSAIFHLSTAGSMSGLKDVSGEAETQDSAVHHVALSCTDFDAVVQRLEELSIAYKIKDNSKVGLMQLFLHDPNGVMIECNFRE